MGTRRQLSREFKLEAVKSVKDRGVSVAQAGRDLDVHENVPRLEQITPSRRAACLCGVTWRHVWICLAAGSTPFPGSS